MFDIIIIGAGPAGLSAAITARARNKDVLVISNDPQESALAKASHIDNYPGMPQISGSSLLEHMLKHAQALGASFDFRKTISILSMGNYFSVGVGDDIFEARTIILATGAQIAKPFKGEAEYLGRGVSYCATCDGMLYRNTSVCVVGLSKDAVEEANFLSEIGCKVIFIAKQQTQGLSDSIISMIGAVKEIKGDSLGVTDLMLKPVGADQVETVSCNGVFILRSSVAPNALITGLELNEGYIMVDADMKTTVPGVFAAGDCVGKPLQISKATGEGQKACFSAVAYLDTQ